MKVTVVLSRSYEVEINDQTPALLIEKTAKENAYSMFEHDMEIGAAYANEDDFSAKIHPHNRIEYIMLTGKSSNNQIQDLIHKYEMGLLDRYALVKGIGSELLVNSDLNHHELNYMKNA